jgi:FkbM family methyltransferase
VAAESGIREIWVAENSFQFDAHDPRLATEIGHRGPEGIVLEPGARGHGLFGPYVELAPGRWRGVVNFAATGALAGRAELDVSAENGRQVLARSRVNLERLRGEVRRVELTFDVDRPLSGCELRLFSHGDVSATITGIDLRPLRVADTATGAADVLAALSRIEARLDRIERMAQSGQGVYVGANRVLTRAVHNGEVLSYLMPADDRIITPWIVTKGAYEPPLVDYFTANIKPTDHCLDLGANFGWFTVLMAHCAPQGRTIGVEPDAYVFELLRDNIFVNHFERCAWPLRAAASDRSGLLTLYRRHTRSSNTSIIRVDAEALATSYGEAPAEAFEVDAVSVDDLLPRFDGRLDFIKIDVEGAEPLVFRGLRRTLETNPQLRIVMEWAPSQIRDAGFVPSTFLEELEALNLDAEIVRGPRVQEPIALRDLAAHPYYSGVLLTRRA